MNSILYFALLGYQNYLTLHNTPSKRKSISSQRKMLELESIKLKKKRSCYEEFDEDESRREHDKATVEAVMEHYQALSPATSKTKKYKQVIQTKVHILKSVLIFCIFSLDYYFENRQ